MIYNYIDDIEIYRIYIFICNYYSIYIYMYIYIQCTYTFHQPSYLLNSQFFYYNLVCFLSLECLFNSLEDIIIKDSLILYV